MKPLSIKDVSFDETNLNLGNGEEGQALIDHSVEQVGWGRSMVMSADNVMLAGNHALETAKRRGEDPVIIDSDGARPIIIRRTDIKSTDPKAKKLGILDNSATQKNLRFDMPRLEATIQELGVEPGYFGFSLSDFTIATDQGDAAGDHTAGGDQGDGGTITGSFQVVVQCTDEEDQQEVFDRLTREGRSCRVLTL